MLARTLGLGPFGVLTSRSHAVKFTVRSPAESATTRSSSLHQARPYAAWWTGIRWSAWPVARSHKCTVRSSLAEGEQLPVGHPHRTHRIHPVGVAFQGAFGGTGGRVPDPHRAIGLHSGRSVGVIRSGNQAAEVSVQDVVSVREQLIDHPSAHRVPRQRPEEGAGRILPPDPGAIIRSFVGVLAENGH